MKRRPNRATVVLAGLGLSAGLAAAAQDAGGWTLRAARNSPPVAVGGGAGDLASLAIFCLSIEPFLAIRFTEPPDAETVQVAFGFASQIQRVEARREAGAGGAFVVALRDLPLAALLAGRDAAVAVSVDGGEPVTLSLAGSTKAIRGALSSCNAL